MVTPPAAERNLGIINAGSAQISREVTGTVYEKHKCVSGQNPSDPDAKTMTYTAPSPEDAPEGTSNISPSPSVELSATLEHVPDVPPHTVTFTGQIYNKWIIGPWTDITISPENLVVRDTSEFPVSITVSGTAHEYSEVNQPSRIR